jgi:hypothetical protein
MRTEPMGLIIVKSEEELNDHDASIYIKDKKNIILSFQNRKKGHRPISFNLNDPIIKSFCQRLELAGKPKMVIICAAMRKLVHVVYGVLKSGKAFDAKLAID